MTAPDPVSSLYALAWFRSPELDGAWRDEGLCLDLANRDRELAQCFFSENVTQQARAKALCAQCPSRVPCLEYGAHEVTGIWGGLGVRERQRWVALHPRRKTS